MTAKTRAISMRDDGIWVDVVWLQEAGSIFETRVISYSGLPAIDAIAAELGEDAVIDGQIFDFRTPEQEPPTP